MDHMLNTLPLLYALRMSSLRTKRLQQIIHGENIDDDSRPESTDKHSGQLMLGCALFQQLPIALHARIERLMLMRKFGKDCVVRLQLTQKDTQAEVAASTPTNIYFDGSDLESQNDFELHNDPAKGSVSAITLKSVVEWQPTSVPEQSLDLLSLQLCLLFSGTVVLENGTNLHSSECWDILDATRDLKLPSFMHCRSNVEIAVLTKSDYQNFMINTLRELNCCMFDVEQIKLELSNRFHGPCETILAILSRARLFQMIPASMLKVFMTSIQLHNIDPQQPLFVEGTACQRCHFIINGTASMHKRHSNMQNCEATSAEIGYQVGCNLKSIYGECTRLLIPGMLIGWSGNETQIESWRIHDHTAISREEMLLLSLDYDALRSAMSEISSGVIQNYHIIHAALSKLPMDRDASEVEALVSTLQSIGRLQFAPAQVRIQMSNDLKLRYHKSDDVICQQGQPINMLIVLIKGNISVHMRADAPKGNYRSTWQIDNIQEVFGTCRFMLVPGELYGLSVFSAVAGTFDGTLIAREPCELLVLSRTDCLSRFPVLDKETLSGIDRVVSFIEHPKRNVDQNFDVIDGVCGGLDLFAPLTVSQKKFLYSRMKLRRVPARRVLFQQGDTGQYMFCILSGSVLVHIRNISKTIVRQSSNALRHDSNAVLSDDKSMISNDREDKKDGTQQASVDGVDYLDVSHWKPRHLENMFGAQLALLKRGAVFGELAVRGKMPRTATVITEEDCFLLQIDHDDLRLMAAAEDKLLTGHAEDASQEEVTAFYMQLPLFADVQDRHSLLKRLAYRTEQELVPRGAPVIKQGTLANELVLIYRGAVHVHRKVKLIPQKLQKSLIFKGQHLNKQFSSILIPATVIGEPKLLDVSLGILEEGTAIGLIEVVLHACHSSTYEAQMPTHVFRIPRQHIFGSAAQNVSSQGVVLQAGGLLPNRTIEQNLRIWQASYLRHQERITAIINKTVVHGTHNMKLNTMLPISLKELVQQMRPPSAVASTKATQESKKQLVTADFSPVSFPKRADKHDASLVLNKLLKFANKPSPSTSIASSDNVSSIDSSKMPVGKHPSLQRSLNKSWSTASLNADRKLNLRMARAIFRGAPSNNQQRSHMLVSNSTTSLSGSRTSKFGGLDSSLVDSRLQSESRKLNYSKSTHSLAI